MELVGWSLLAACVGVTSVAGLVVYHAVCGYWHYRYYVRRRLEPDVWKIRPDRFLSPKLQRTTILAGSRNMAFFAPETHVSTGLHQVPGPCDVEESDILGGTRQTYLCVDNYEEDFTFACTTPPAYGTRWFTVCGKAHTNYAAHMATVGGLSLAGIALFAMLCGATRRAATRGDERAPEDADTATERHRWILDPSLQRRLPRRDGAGGPSSRPVPRQRRR